MKINFPDRCKIITDNFSVYAEQFNTSKKFVGPSLFFHCKAISENNFEQKLIYTYATLSSWGMHRMGKGGAKMVEFKEFYDSVKKFEKEINHLENLELSELNNTEEFKNILYRIFEGITVMDGKTYLVGNSKVLAHLLPKLVPPIDREYTLKFLLNKENITLNPDKINQTEIFVNILEEFFLPLSKNSEIIKYYTECKNKNLNNEFHWHTSVPKFIDNIVIGARLHTFI